MKGRLRKGGKNTEARERKWCKKVCTERKTVKGSYQTLKEGRKE
jgi:hypothetical protein